MTPGLFLQVRRGGTITESGLSKSILWSLSFRLLCYGVRETGVKKVSVSWIRCEIGTAYTIDTTRDKKSMK